MGVGAVMAGQAGLGAITGGYGAYESNKGTRAELKQRGAESEKIQQLIKDMQSGTIRDAGTAYSTQTQGFDDNFQNLLSQLQNSDYSKFDLQPTEDFQFDMNQATQDEMNPDLQAIIDRSVQGNIAEGASGGSLYSGSTGKNIARGTADIQAREWDAARGRAEQAKQGKYSEFTDKWNRGKDIMDSKRQNYNSGLTNLGSAVGLQQDAFTKQRNEVTEANRLANQNMLQSKQQQGLDYAQLKGMPSNLSAIISGGLGGMTSALGGK